MNGKKDITAPPQKYSLLSYQYIPLSPRFKGLHAEKLHMTETLKRQIICGASRSPQGSVHSLRQLPPPLQQLHSSGGRPSGGRLHSPLPQAGHHSPLEGAGQKHPGGTLPEPPGGFSGPELGGRTEEEKTG